MVQSQAPRSLTISKLAAGGGVGVETIRYYQRKGLLGIPTRDTGIRRYGADDLRRLRFIRRAQAAGFTLQEIKELLQLDAGHDHPRARQLAETRLESITAKIGELERARASLEVLARRCSDGRDEPCPILASFGV